MIFHAHSDLINDIGPRAVVARFGLSPQSLYNWRVRGVPALMRVAFARFAADEGKAVPADFLDPLHHEGPPAEREIAEQVTVMAGGK